MLNYQRVVPLLQFSCNVCCTPCVAPPQDNGCIRAPLRTNVDPEQDISKRKALWLKRVFHFLNLNLVDYPRIMFTCVTIHLETNSTVTIRILVAYHISYLRYIPKTLPIYCPILFISTIQWSTVNKFPRSKVNHELMVFHPIVDNHGNQYHP